MTFPAYATLLSRVIRATRTPPPPQGLLACRHWNHCATYRKADDKVSWVGKGCSFIDTITTLLWTLFLWLYPVITRELSCLLVWIHLRCSLQDSVGKKVWTCFEVVCTFWYLSLCSIQNSFNVTSLLYGYMEVKGLLCTRVDCWCICTVHRSMQLTHWCTLFADQPGPTTRHTEQVTTDIRILVYSVCTWRW